MTELTTFTLKDGSILSAYVNDDSLNIQIKDSYLVTNLYEQQEIITKLYNKYSWWAKRSIDSYCIEWRAHNVLYKWHIKESSTKDVDLDVNEKWYRRLAYFFISLWPQGD